MPGAREGFLTMNVNTSFIVAVLAVAATNAGCGGSKCETYEADLDAKYEECGNPQTESSASTGTGGAEDTCDDAAAAKADCLELCLPNANCECIMNPAGPDCIMKQQAWNDCMNACNGGAP
jgi:hypothetical protein